MGYGKASREAVENAPVGGSTDFWQPDDGENRIRVMPPWGPDVEDFWFATGTHFNVGPDERRVYCPDVSGVRETCFICRLVKRLSRGDEDEQAESEAMGARPRYLLNIVDLDEPEKGVQVWECPKTIFRQLKKFFLNEDDYGDFTDLEDGYDIIVEKSGSGINTKYDATPARKNTAFPTKALVEHRNEAVAEVYQQLADQELELTDLSSVPTFLSDAEMEKVYKGLSTGRRDTSKEEPEDESEGNGEEEEEERPRSRRSRRDEGDDKDGDEGDDDGDGDKSSEEEEEEQERPRGRRSRSKSKEDDSGDGDGDGDGEDKPKSRLRGRVRDLS